MKVRLQAEVGCKRPTIDEGGIEGMFRSAGRDKSTPRPDGFEIPTARLAAASETFGIVIVGPTR